MRLRQMSHRPDASYLHYIVEFMRFQGKRYARELGIGEIRAYLSYQATEKDGAVSTQNMALSALLFLYRRELGYAMAVGGEFPDDYHWFCARCYGAIRYMRSSQNLPSTRLGESVTVGTPSQSRRRVLPTPRPTPRLLHNLATLRRGR
jgi:hypothetical protein